jgi:hypothetical protein
MNAVLPALALAPGVTLTVTTVPLIGHGAQSKVANVAKRSL